jgi:hypothetical protein
MPEYARDLDESVDAKRQCAGGTPKEPVWGDRGYACRLRFGVLLVVSLDHS